MPSLNLQNHQRKVALDLSLIRKAALASLPLCISCCGSQADRSPRLLRTFEEIDIAIVSDRKIAQVHKDFLNDPTPTDVITFPYGEIVVSADTAQHQAKQAGYSTEQELSLYIIHGLLHLNGYDDHTQTQRKEMHARQSKILKAVFKNLCQAVSVHESI
ncbi:MAG: rRNA maturation RNase YbeY [Chthoniobacterales bacterium]